MMPNPLIFLARLEGFEPSTHGLEVRCSIRLSYRRKSEPLCYFIHNNPRLQVHIMNIFPPLVSFKGGNEAVTPGKQNSCC